MSEAQDRMSETRIKGLKKKADELGLAYSDETSEDALRTAIKEEESRRELAAKAALVAAPTGQSVDKDGLVFLAKAMKDALRPDTIVDGIVSEADLDPSDAVEERTYFHPASFWKLPLKRVGGQAVKPPFRPIIFKLEQGSSVRNGTQFNTRYLSAFKTKSAREQAYIETHPMFGKRFSRDYSQAVNLGESAEKGVIFARHLQSLSVVQSADLYNMAGSLGINTSMSEDLGKLRARIANEYTEREVERKAAERKRILAGSSKADLLTSPAQQNG